jgi:predicted permease
MGANCTSRVDMGRDATPVGRMAQLHNAWVGPGYFDAIGARQLSGRGFTERDTAASPRVAVISAAVASRYFPGQTAVGRHVLFQQLDTEIVGVVADMRGLNLRESPAPVIYVPVAQPSAFTPAASSLEVRVSGDPSRAVLPIQDAIRRAEPALIVDNVRTMNQRLDRALTRERLVAYLSSVFGLLTLLLACTGLYGVLSYSVARRATEIGVRAALGAGPGRLAWMVMADALYIVVPGVVVGVSTALSLRRLLNTLLFGVTASDPSTYVVATALLSVVALVAVYLPARRAAQADPMHALRAE